MARIILTVGLIVLLNVLTGCNGEGPGRARIRLRPPRERVSIGQVDVAGMRESDIVEQLAENRLAYRRGLETLAKYYAETGSNMNLSWAEKELTALNSMLQYNYIVEAALAGPNLKATTPNHRADDLYYDGLLLEDKARRLIIIKNGKLLRQALEKYNQLIRNYPSSDKIDDAAYRAAGIYEESKEYAIAALYYQRTFQWNPDTHYPAVFNAAYVLDIKLRRRAEALELYQQAVKTEGLHYSYVEFAQNRIAELTKSEEAEQ